MENQRQGANYQQLWGIFMALLGAVMFSTKAVFVKLAYQYEVDAISLLLFRMLFSLPIFLGIAIYLSQKAGTYRPKGKDYWQIFALGILGYYLASLFDFLGLQYISASLERLVLFIYPTIVVLIGVFFFREKLSWQQIIALILTYIGIMIVFFGNVEIGSKKDLYTGGALILGSALCYALYLAGSGRLLPKMGTWVFTSYALTVSSSAVIIHYLIYNQGFASLDFPWQVYMYAALMASFSTVIPTFLVSEGIRLIGASNAAIVGSSGPISTIILAYIFLGERLSMVQIMGGVLVLGGVLFISLQQKKKQALKKQTQKKQGAKA
ncbi:MAG: DMT family transporter [Bacteroidia bacterium]|nr:DMT family transporter [Bacteroidia bacterium]